MKHHSGREMQSFSLLLFNKIHLLLLYIFTCSNQAYDFPILLSLQVKPYLSAEEKSQLSKVVESQNLGNNPSVTNVEVSYSTDFIAT